MTHKDAPGQAKEMACPRSIEDVDLFAPGAQEHWYQAYPILHAEAPVLKLAGEGLVPGSDGYVLSKYADIARVVKDPRRFTPVMTLLSESLARMISRGEEPPSDGLDFNVALESVYRLRPSLALWRSHRQELTDPWVGPGAKRHTGMIRRSANALIDAWIDRPATTAGDHKKVGQLEFIAEFARPLPQFVLAGVMGFPAADIPQLAAWGNAQVMGFVHGSGHRNILTPQQSTEQAQQLKGFREYVAQQVADKRASPGDDMISALTTITYRALGRKLTDKEIHGIVYFMILGGLETTQYALGEQARLLCDDPELFQQLRAEPAKIRAFTEEAMRLRAPTQGLSTRITTRDETFQGVTVAAGSLLHLRWAAGNVDPDKYSCPYQTDLERKAIGNHLSFSQGPRNCPGAGLSRIEQIVAWEQLLERVDTLEYAADNSFAHQPGIMLGTLELHLKFSKA